MLCNLRSLLFQKWHFIYLKKNVSLSAIKIKIKLLISRLKITGKSLSEALIFASTNPQYDDRLFIELQVQYMKIPSSNLCCVQKLFLTFRTFFGHNKFSPCSAKRRASVKDLPVLKNVFWTFEGSFFIFSWAFFLRPCSVRTRVSYLFTYYVGIGFLNIARIWFNNHLRCQTMYFFLATSKCAWRPKVN